MQISKSQWRRITPKEAWHEYLVSAQTRLEALWMAQQYYPESLGHGYVCYPPLLFNVLWRAAQPFLDPVTKCAAAEVALPHGLKESSLQWLLIYFT